MSDLHHDSQRSAQVERGRKAARRTALLLGAIAIAVYAGFLVLGAMGK